LRVHVHLDLLLNLRRYSKQGRQDTFSDRSLAFSFLTRFNQIFDCLSFQLPTALSYDHDTTLNTHSRVRVSMIDRVRWAPPSLSSQTPHIPASKHSAKPTVAS
jgi:hypothetical protein